MSPKLGSQNAFSHLLSWREQPTGFFARNAIQLFHQLLQYAMHERQDCKKQKDFKVLIISGCKMINVGSQVIKHPHALWVLHLCIVMDKPLLARGKLQRVEIRTIAGRWAELAFSSPRVNWTQRKRRQTYVLVFAYPTWWHIAHVHCWRRLCFFQHKQNSKLDTVFLCLWLLYAFDRGKRSAGWLRVGVPWKEIFSVSAQISSQSHKRGICVVQVNMLAYWCIKSRCCFRCFVEESFLHETNIWCQWDDHHGEGAWIEGPIR